MQGQPVPDGSDGELLLRVHPNVGDLSSLGVGAVSAFGYKSFDLPDEDANEGDERGGNHDDADLAPEEFERIQSMINARGKDGEDLQ